MVKPKAVKKKYQNVDKEEIAIDGGYVRGATSFPCKVLMLKRRKLCISYATEIISFKKHSKLVFCKKSPRIFCWNCTLDVPLVSKSTCVDMNFLYLALQHV